MVYLILFRNQENKVFRDCPTKHITLTKTQCTVAVFQMHNIKIKIYNNAYYESCNLAGKSLEDVGYYIVSVL